MNINTWETLPLLNKKKFHHNPKLFSPPNTPIQQGKHTTHSKNNTHTHLTKKTPSHTHPNTSTTPHTHSTAQTQRKYITVKWPPPPPSHIHIHPHTHQLLKHCNWAFVVCGGWVRGGAEGGGMIFANGWCGGVNGSWVEWDAMSCSACCSVSCAVSCSVCCNEVYGS